MNLRDEEQLQQYFERKMTSGEEQNFLINIAARDDMRLAFRSQLELLRAVRADKDVFTSAVLVRSRTLTALGLGAALLPNALKDNEVAQAALVPQANSLWSFIKRPVSMLVAGVLLGTAVTYSLAPSSNTSDIHQAAIKQTAPATLIITEPTAQQPISTDQSSSQTGIMKQTPATHKTATLTQKKSEPSDVPLVKKSKAGTIEVQTTNHPADGTTSGQK